MSEDVQESQSDTMSAFLTAGSCSDRTLIDSSDKNSGDSGSDDHSQHEIEEVRRGRKGSWIGARKFDNHEAAGSALGTLKGSRLSTDGKKLGDFDCRVLGRIGEKGTAKAHNCRVCGAPVHLMCCTRILVIAIEDASTDVFRSRCYQQK